MQLPDTMPPIESMSQHEKKHMKLLHERHEALTDSGSYSRFLFGSYSQALTAVFLALTAKMSWSCWVQCAFCSALLVSLCFNVLQNYNLLYLLYVL